MEDVTFKLVETIFQISRLMKEELSFENKLMRLSALQFHTLMFLDRNKDVTMTALAKHFNVELPSATNLVATLCDHNLILRCASSEDRRLVMLKLTNEGQRLLEEVKKFRRNKLEKNLSLFSNEEKSELLNLLKILQSRLQK